MGLKVTNSPPRGGRCQAALSRTPSSGYPGQGWVEVVSLDVKVVG